MNLQLYDSSCLYESSALWFFMFIWIFSSMNLHVYMNLQLYDSSCLNESPALWFFMFIWIFSSMILHVYMNLQLYESSCLYESSALWFFMFKWIFSSDSSCLYESDSLRDPESGVQMRFRSDDPRSVNESECEQVNGSMFRGWSSSDGLNQHLRSFCYGLKLRVREEWFVTLLYALDMYTYYMHYRINKAFSTLK